MITKTVMQKVSNKSVSKVEMVENSQGYTNSSLDINELCAMLGLGNVSTLPSMAR